MEDNTPAVHLVLGAMLLIIIVNLFLIDIKLWGTPGAFLSQTQTVAPSPLPSAIPTASNAAEAASNAADAQGDSCPAACQSLIASLSPPTAAPPIQAVQSTPREVYVPLGSGTTRSSQWEDIPTTETLINPTLYGTITEAYFIAPLRNPTGNGQVEAQLYNVTDKHPVWGSHVTLTGSTSQTVTSGTITLENGPRLYRVQIKSTLSYDAYLDQAKIRIVTQ